MSHDNCVGFSSEYIFLFSLFILFLFIIIIIISLIGSDGPPYSCSNGQILRQIKTFYLELSFQTTSVLRQVRTFFLEFSYEIISVQSCYEHWWSSFDNPASNYMFDVNNRNTRTRCETCSKFTIKIPERRHCSTVSIVNFEQVNAGWEMKNWSWLVTSFFNFSGLVTVGFLSVKSSWV